MDIAIAGGMENMDRAPYLMPAGRWGQRMGDSVLHDSMLHDGLYDAFSGEHSAGIPKTFVARFRTQPRDTGSLGRTARSGISPLAQANGRFTGEIAGVTVKVKERYGHVSG
ncbi:hypothetical protein ACTMU2_06145 [Cupriavidus basilensis]